MNNQHHAPMPVCVQEGQRDPAVELPAGVAARAAHEARTLPPAAEDLPGDALHPRLDGGNQGEHLAVVILLLL